MDKQSKRKPKPQMRNMATGGAPPPNQASKQQRQAGQDGEVVDEQERGQQGSNTNARGSDVMTSSTPAQAHEPATPIHSRAGASPMFSNTSLDHIRTPTVQLSQYFTASTAGPSMPAAEKTIDNPIQVSARYGQKLKPLDPRTSAKVKGVDPY